MPRVPGKCARLPLSLVALPVWLSCTTTDARSLLPADTDRVLQLEMRPHLRETSAYGVGVAGHTLCGWD